MKQASNILQEIFDTIGRRYAFKYFFTGVFIGYFGHTAQDYYYAHKDDVNELLTGKIPVQLSAEHTAHTARAQPKQQVMLQNIEHALPAVPATPRIYNNALPHKQVSANPHRERGPTTLPLIPVREQHKASRVDGKGAEGADQVPADDHLIILVTGLASAQEAKRRIRTFRERRINCELLRVQDSFWIVIRVPDAHTKMRMEERLLEHGIKTVRQKVKIQ